MPAKESESPMPNLSRADVLTFKMAPSAQSGSGSVCSCALHMHSGDFRHPQIFQWNAVSINGRCEENPSAIETCSCPAAGWAGLSSAARAAAGSVSLLWSAAMPGRTRPAPGPALDCLGCQMAQGDAYWAR